MRVVSSALILVSLGCIYGQSNAGAVRFIRRTNSSFDPYLDNPSSSRKQWFRDQFWRMAVFSPYFDDKLSWYQNADFYKNLFAIYKSDPLVSQHPEWILKDSNGHKLYIDWQCANGTCPQYAGDFTSTAFRQRWIQDATAVMGHGYHGMWIDDVDLDFRTSDGWGNAVTPIDPNTGALMTESNWRLYITQFVEAIRSAFPNSEIIHNSIWFADHFQDSDPIKQRQIKAGNYQNIEWGVNDNGLTGGTGTWSLYHLLSYIDHVHAANRAVIIDHVPASGSGAEYGLANYYLISNGIDGLGNDTTTPDNWWSGFDTDLGSAVAGRYGWNNLYRRDYTGGIVLVNPPDSANITVGLPKTYRRTSGSLVTSVTLGAKQGAVLIDPSPSGDCPGPATNAFTGCYYKDKSLTSLAMSRTDASINFSWGSGSPASMIPNDGFSVKWEGKFSFNASTYVFAATTDDGFRLYIDGSLVLDKWFDHAATTYTVSRNMSGGTHTIKLTYYENTGGSSARLSW